MSFPDDKDFNQRKMTMFCNSWLCTERNPPHNFYTLVIYKKSLSFPDDQDFNQAKMTMFLIASVYTKRKPLTLPLHAC